MDALSSAVALKVNLAMSVQLTLMASSLYRYLGQQIGNGYETVKSRHLFPRFPSTPPADDRDRRNARSPSAFKKRAHNPLLLAAGFDKTDIPDPLARSASSFPIGMIRCDGVRSRYLRK